MQRNFTIKEENDLSECGLYLQMRGITDQDVIEVIIPYLIEHPKIFIVNLSSNNIGDIGAAALAKMNISKLLIGGNKIGTQGAIALSQSTTLRTLWIMENNIGDLGIKALISNTTINNLCVLNHGIDIHHPFHKAYINDMTDEGMTALNETDPLKRANYGREAGLNTFPSLERICLFALKQKHPQADQDLDQYLPEDLLEKLKQKKV